MTKKTFLRKLGIKLDVLKEEEKKDILDEYSSHIDEKVSKGKTEKEAVEDFGDIDALASEILDAYKIKSNKKDDDKSKFDEFINDFVETMKEIFKNISKSIDEDTAGFIVKVILVIILFGLLRIPFGIIGGIGASILRTLSFGFLGNGLVSVWSIAVEIAYVLVATIIGMSILSNNGNLKEFYDKYFKGYRDHCQKYHKNGNKRNEKELKNKEKEVNKKNNTEVKEGSIRVGRYNNSPLMILLKIFVVIFLIPFIFTQIGFVITLGIFIKFAFEGIVIWGLLAIMVGLIGINGVFMRFVVNVIFYPEKLKIGMVVNLIIAFLFIGFGSAALIFDIMNYDYVNKTPEHHYKYIVQESSYLIPEKVLFSYDYGTVEIIDDDSLSGEMKIETKYIDELVNVSGDRNDNKIVYNLEDKEFDFGEVKIIYNLFINDLRDKEVRNYMRLFMPEYTIYVHPDEKEKIEIEKTGVSDIDIDVDDIHIRIDDGDMRMIEID